MKTAIQELIEQIDFKAEMHVDTKVLLVLANLKSKALNLLEKEKEQTIAAVRYGQNNHTASVYDEGELYYNEIYNSDAPIIKSSIPNGNIKITKTNKL
jgi:hypothetical protein